MKPDDLHKEIARSVFPDLFRASGDAQEATRKALDAATAFCDECDAHAERVRAIEAKAAAKAKKVSEAKKAAEVAAKKTG